MRPRRSRPLTTACGAHRLLTPRTSRDAPGFHPHRTTRRSSMIARLATGSWKSAPRHAAALPLETLSFLLAALPACVSTQQRVAQKEDQLAAAGFEVKPANTPEREQMLRRLPPNRFVQRVHGDNVHYVYADPIVCNCLYVGTQQAYNNLKEHER